MLRLGHAIGQWVALDSTFSPRWHRLWHSRRTLQRALVFQGLLRHPATRIAEAKNAECIAPLSHDEREELSCDQTTKPPRFTVNKYEKVSRVKGDGQLEADQIRIGERSTDKKKVHLTVFLSSLPQLNSLHYRAQLRLRRMIRLLSLTQRCVHCSHTTSFHEILPRSARYGTNLVIPARTTKRYATQHTLRSLGRHRAGIVLTERGLAVAVLEACRILGSYYHLVKGEGGLTALFSQRISRRRDFTPQNWGSRKVYRRYRATVYL